MVDIEKIIEITQIASKIVMSYYDKPVKVSRKSDASPVTEADIAVNAYIVGALKELYPEIPVIAEENNAEENKLLEDSEEFWLVDPIDGTKSFIDHEDEFTINIGLVRNKKPVLGVLYSPVSQEYYYTKGDGKAYHFHPEHGLKEMKANQDISDGVIITASSTSKDGIEEFIKTVNMKEFIAAASALKFGLVAEGRADIYPRFGRTMEWDTACGQAILEAAGGEVVDMEGKSLTYGKENFANPNFIASSKKS